jgi:hypothetical protein
MKFTAAVALLAIAAGTARADEVVLRNGAKFEGKVKEQGDTVTVVMDFGSMTFRKMDVARIDRGLSPIAEFDAKVAELKSDDLDGKLQLAIWARQKELHHRSRNLLENILARDPGHAGAREALGFRRFKGQWLTDDDLKREQGLVLYQGGWMRREAAGVRPLLLSPARVFLPRIPLSVPSLQGAALRQHAAVHSREARTLRRREEEVVARGPA